MPSGQNNMDNNLDDQFLIIQDMIDYNMQYFNDKMKEDNYKLEKQDSKLEKITETIKNMMDQNKNPNSFLGHTV